MINIKALKWNRIAASSMSFWHRITVFANNKKHNLKKQTNKKGNKQDVWTFETPKASCVNYNLHFIWEQYTDSTEKGEPSFN